MNVHASSQRRPVVVIGGGVAGLIAAARIAGRGVPVTLLEKTTHVGGRAATRNRDGFLFNLGPHALYRRGMFHSALQELGVEIRGAIPPARGGLALSRGELHTLPIGFVSLLSTGLLPLAGKLELGRLLAMLPKMDAEAVRQQTLASWLDAHVRDPRVREVVEMLVRVTTFTHDPARQSAGAALSQLQLALRGNVLYLDGGWQTIADGLRTVADNAGVDVRAGVRAIGLEGERGAVSAVRLADGTAIPAAAVVIAAPPDEVDRLTGVTQFARALTPVCVASLAVAVRRLPNPKTLVAFGTDQPLYYSVHSAAARLAPAGGALIHVAQYFAPGERAGEEIERRLEAFLDRLQPRWDRELVAKQYLPHLVVTHAEVLAASARPSSTIPEWTNVFIAGDWVGTRGQLSDAAAASAEDAALCAVAA